MQKGIHKIIIWCNLNHPEVDKSPKAQPTYVLNN